MTSQARVVLDASALLAFLFREPGSDAVSALIRGAYMSTVNWAEVSQTLARRGADSAGLRADFERAGLRFVSFTIDDAERVADLYLGTREAQLSIADRACLALAQRLGLSAVTGDQVWADIDVGVEVTLFRNADDA